MIQPPNYDGRLIRPLRPPEITHDNRGWISRWIIRLQSVEEALLDRLESELSQDDSELSVKLSPVNNEVIVLEMRTKTNPLDVDCYETVDRALRLIDAQTSGIKEINDSPKDWWRTFRK